MPSHQWDFAVPLSNAGRGGGELTLLDQQRQNSGMWDYLKHSKLFGLGVALLVAALVCVGFTAKELATERQLRQAGVTTEGVIVDKRETKSSKGATKRRIHVRFTDEAGTTHTTVHSASKLWPKQIGDSVPVVYVREDPSTSRIEGDHGSSVYLILTLAFGLGGVLVLLPQVLRAKRFAAGR
jgi:hypothetical protein